MATTKKTVKAATEKPVEKAAKSTAKKSVKAAAETVKAPAKKTVAKAEKVTSKVLKAAAPKAVADEKTSVKSAKKTESVKAEKTVKTAAKSLAKASAKKSVKAETETVKAPAKKTATKAAKLEVENDSLAHSFNPEYLVLMQKDPNWMHAFWEVSEERVKAAAKGKSKLVLRLFDISTDLTVRKGKQKRFRDVVVPADARSWYVETTDAKANVAVLGTVSGNKFTPIVESEPVLAFDKNAAAPAADNAFVTASLGGATLGNFMSSGFSSQTANSWLESLRLGSSSESFFSGSLSSAALAQGGSADIATSKDSVNYGKDFFLWVKTRLIVYGGTRPDAHLQVRGEPFPLRPDGTFSFEEDLPDCTKVIPVFATDKDGDFPTTIVPIVVKRTE